MSFSDKHKYKAYLDAFAHPDRAGFQKAVADFIAPDGVVNVVHPYNEIAGDAYFETFFGSLLNAFEGLHRRDYIITQGEFDGASWVSSTGYYVGHFSHDWLGIKASNALQYLRVGEFHRVKNGKSLEAYVYLDIPELMIAVGQWPDIECPAVVKGYTGMLPGPATSDGMDMTPHDPALSQSSLAMVSEMLLGLATEDEAWRPYWHENMMWYGPAAFGSFVGVENFHAFQVPFEGLFSHWIGGSVPGSKTKHFTRHGDGNYVCSGGWPSLNARQIKPFLSQPATHKDLFMRVCDWWRREGDLLIENWVFVDIPHVLLQMDYDLFGELGYVPSNNS